MVSVLVVLGMFLAMAGVSVAQDTGSLININTADETALSTLTQIGQAKARAIVAYRMAHGGFKTVNDIVAVPGIGEKIFEKIKDRITVGMEEKKQG
jgi:competence protein ComEA